MTGVVGHQRLLRLFELSNDLLAACDRDGRLTLTNPAWQTTLGWSGPSLRGRTFFDLLHPDDRADARNHVRAAHEASGTVAFEARVGTDDHGWRWTMWSASRDDHGWYAVGKDLSEHKERERLALTDPLTGLPNRALALDRLGAAIARVGRSSQAAVVLLVDVDGLGRVNDMQGHATGDSVLCAVADRLCDRLRASDTVGRLGDDQFLVVAEGVRDIGKGVDAVIERVMGAFTRPIPTRHGPLTVNGSVGVSVARDPHVKPEDLLRDADVALRRAKAQGTGEAEVFDAALAEEVRGRLMLAEDLRGALQRGELRIVFQPLVALAHGAPIGYEALLRWDHPARGQIGPDDFLRIAEEDGLIVPIGAWMLEQACRQVSRWRAASHDVFVSVNVSARQLTTTDFVPVVERVLRETGVPATAICLEVTETAMLRRPEVVGRALGALRGLGLRVALDDFGRGYSSLTHLKTLPVDVLKVDKLFVTDLRDSTEDRAVIEAVLTLAHRMGLTVIAEGVETPAQDAVLRELGCPVVQGYLYGRPAPAGEVALPPVASPDGVITSSRP